MDKFGNALPSVAAASKKIAAVMKEPPGLNAMQKQLWDGFALQTVPVMGLEAAIEMWKPSFEVRRRQYKMVFDLCVCD